MPDTIQKVILGNQIITKSYRGSVESYITYEKVLENPTSLNVEYLVVGGGGGGGANAGGGGGAGGFVTGSATISGRTSYSVYVGEGGAPAYRPGGTYVNGTNGETSSFDSFVALGGGRGGAGSGYNYVGADGGSGGGGQTNQLYPHGGVGLQPLSGSGNFGNDGGSGSFQFINSDNAIYGGGGGAGASADGEDGAITANAGSRGGDGMASSITGTLTYYAGGGGGCRNHNSTTTAATGGVGGGGNGGYGDQDPNGPATLAPTNGQTNTGGGGGGAAAGAYSGAYGGSGIVVVRYLGPQVFFGGDDIYQSGGYTIHKFTTTGAHQLSKQ